MKFLRRKSSKDKYVSVCENVGVVVKQKTSLSDKAYDELLKPVVNLVVLHGGEVLLIRSLDACIDKPYFQNGKVRGRFKIACVVTILLVATHVILEKRDPNYVDPETKGFVEIEYAGVFFRLLSKTQEGYAWVNGDKAIMEDAWFYLRSRAGNFAEVLMMGETGAVVNNVPEDRQIVKSSLAKDDVDETFTSSKAEAIDDFFSNDEEVSDEEMNSLMGSGDDSGGGDIADELSKPEEAESSEDEGEKSGEGIDPLNYF